jgi:hypothetical protein
MADKDQGGKYAPTRVPVETKPAEEETIEEMVRRMERELEEFSHLFSAAAPTAAAAATATRVPEAVTELMELKIENKQFAYSFVEIKIKVPPDPAKTNHKVWRLEVKVEEQPEEGQSPTNQGRTDGATGTPERLRSGATEQKPPEIDPAVRPPPDRDRSRRSQFKGCRKHQLKGCRRGRYSQSTSAKGVLDIVYLCPRPRVRGRIPIEDWRPPTGTQRTRRHGRSVFGRPAQ